MSDLIHLQARLMGRPHMLSAPRFEQIIHALLPKLADPTFKFERVENPPGSNLALRETDRAINRHLFIREGVAVLDISGTLVNRAGVIANSSELRSFEKIRQDLETLMAAGDVEGVVTRLDSPGGEGSRAFELGELIAQAASVKPIVALADDMAASAAFLIAASAGEFVISATSMTASIGVVLAHFEDSKFLKKAGRTFNIIRSDARKAAVNTVEPLNATERAALKAEVDEMAEAFRAAVVQARGVSLETITGLQGAVVTGLKAIELGLADSEGDLDFAIQRVKALAARGASSTLMKTQLKEEPAMAEPNQLNLVPAVEPAPAQVAPATGPAPAPAVAPPAAEAELVLSPAQSLEVDQICVIAGLDIKQAISFKESGKTVAEIRQQVMKMRAKAGGDPVTAAFPPSHGATADELGAKAAQRKRLHALVEAGNEEGFKPHPHLASYLTQIEKTSDAAR